MTIEVTDHISVPDRATALGCLVPTGMAFLPHNFASASSREDLVHLSEVPTLRKLFRQASIPETPLEPAGQSFPQLAQKGFEAWVGPTIFVSLSLISDNPHLIALALNVLANHISDALKGLAGPEGCKLDVVIQTKRGSYKRAHYEGPVSGLEHLQKTIERIARDE